MAVRWLRVSAAAGNPEAQNDLGYCVHYGLGCERTAPTRFAGTFKLRNRACSGLSSMDDSRRRELYRPARLSVDHMDFLVIEPPDVNCPWLKAGRVRIDAGEGQPPQSSSTLPIAPAGAWTTWIYLEELNTFLFFSAGNASLEWTGPEVNRH
jgi:hypothetical protein